jgi:hypothetical protein
MEHHTIDNLKATVKAARHCASVARSLELQGFTRHAAENRAAARVYMARARHIAATLKARAIDAATQSAPVGKLKKGEYIRRTATAKRVYVRGDYVRAMGVYECQAADDMNSVIYIKSAKPVFFGFTY